MSIWRNSAWTPGAKAKLAETKAKSASEKTERVGTKTETAGTPDTKQASGKANCTGNAGKKSVLQNKTENAGGSLLEIEHGCFGYEKQPEILRDISFSLQPGRILAVLGPNGVGKTTLLKCMTGLLHWKSGRSLYCGKDIRTMPPKELWSSVSYIPQSHTFAFSFTGLEMVMLGRNAHLGMFEQPGEKELAMAEEMMERTGIIRLRDKDCNRMSGGELQMVLIARALINEPRLIILDEPETGLDFHNQILVLDMIERLAHEQGISAVMNTHYPTNALSVSDDALMLDRDGTYLYGRTTEILNEENISRAFDVNVAVNQFEYGGKTVRSIVPVSLAEGAIDG